MRIYLDDVRPCPEGFTLARSYEEFKALIAHIQFDVPTLVAMEISFDHDLGLEESGYDCVKLLVSQNIVPSITHVHSQNPVGKTNILSLLNNWRRHFLELCESKTQKES